MRSSCPASTPLEYLACLVPEEGRWSSVGGLRYLLTSSWASRRCAVPLISAIERQHKHICGSVNGIASCVFHYVRGKGAGLVALCLRHSKRYSRGNAAGCSGSRHCEVKANASRVDFYVADHLSRAFYSHSLYPLQPRYICRARRPL